MASLKRSVFALLVNPDCIASAKFFFLNLIYFWWPQALAFVMTSRAKCLRSCRAAFSPARGNKLL